MLLIGKSLTCCTRTHRGDIITSFLFTAYTNERTQVRAIMSLAACNTLALYSLEVADHVHKVTSHIFNEAQKLPNKEVFS